MKRMMLAVGLLFVSACAGGSYTANEPGGIKQRDICADIPVGIAKFQYIDPSVENLKISCADVARCAALTGGTPANVPCE